MKKRSTIINNLLIILVIYLAYAILVYIFQRSLIFPGKHIGAPEVPYINSYNIERTWLKTSVGKVEAWYMPAADSADKKKRPVVIFAHGNYELIDYCAVEFRQYNSLGVDVLLVEYPGYGRSEGHPSQDTLTEVFVNAYDWLINNKDIDSERIIVHGRSVGGGPVCLLAMERRVKAVIVQSTFTDIRQFAWRYLVPPVLVRDPFDNLSALKSFNGPILIFHGKNDDIIPYKNAKILHENLKNSILITLNCHHNDCPPDQGDYWERIRLFLRENGVI